MAALIFFPCSNTKGRTPSIHSVLYSHVRNQKILPPHALSANLTVELMNFLVNDGVMFSKISLVCKASSAFLAKPLVLLVVDFVLVFEKVAFAFKAPAAYLTEKLVQLAVNTLVVIQQVASVIEALSTCHAQKQRLWHNQQTALQPMHEKVITVILSVR